MNAYALGHVALMHVFLGVFWLLVAFLAAAGGLALVRWVASAPEGEEDRTGFHQGRRNLP